MNIVIYGTGGVGGYFGARLAQAGNNVTFIARGKQKCIWKKQMYQHYLYICNENFNSNSKQYLYVVTYMLRT